MFDVLNFFFYLIPITTIRLKHLDLSNILKALFQNNGEKKTKKQIFEKEEKLLFYNKFYFSQLSTEDFLQESRIDQHNT